MKLVAFLSGLCGVAAGLMFGLLMWGRADVASPPLAMTSRHETEVLEALRELREAVERNGQAARLATGASLPTHEVLALEPSAAVPVEELKVTLDEILRELRAVAPSLGSLSEVDVHPDAAEHVNELHASVRRGERPGDSMLRTPLEIYRHFGKPFVVSDFGAGGLAWRYQTAEGPLLALIFKDGYVVQVMHDP